MAPNPILCVLLLSPILLANALPLAVAVAPDVKGALPYPAYYY